MNINETVRVHPVPQNNRSIYIFDGINAPKEVDLTSFGKNEITFGRDAGNDIVLASHLASRRHGAFILDNNQWFIVDRGSTNGIIHNGHEETRIALCEDDYVRIDDGVESVADGVLMLFPAKEYSSGWIARPISEIKAYLLSFPAFANIELKNGETHIEFGSTNSVLINQHRATGDMLLHEKDVISFPGHRLVYTAKAIYDNLQTCVAEHPESYNEAAALVQVEENSSRTSRDFFEQPVPEHHPIINEVEAKEPAREPFVQSQVRAPIRQNYREQMPRQNEYPPSHQSNGGIRGFLASAAGYYVMSIVIALVIWGVTVALWTSEGEAALIVILACSFFGWKALNNIQPAMFIWMSWLGWIIYFCVKFILSAIIGLFVAPFKIGKWIACAIHEAA